MKRKRTRSECIELVYLNKTDIQTLLEVSQYVAARIYEAADTIDRELGSMRIEPRKVRMKSVLKVSGADFNLLRKQIKGA